MEPGSLMWLAMLAGPIFGFYTLINTESIFYSMLAALVAGMIVSNIETLLRNLL